MSDIPLGNCGYLTRHICLHPDNTQNKELFMAKGTIRNTIFILTGVAVVVALLFTGVRSYNSLQWGDEEVNAGWAHVVNQYQRRADLVPNLVRVVQAYAKHERELFEEIARARAAAMGVKSTGELFKNPQKLAEYQQVQDQMGNALSRLLLIVERYPELRSDQGFLDLQAQLEGTENRISYARDKYINAVRNFNFMVRSIPTSLIASQLDYHVRPNFTLSEQYSTADKPPVVDL
jgi:LemA protein